MISGLNFVAHKERDKKHKRNKKERKKHKSQKNRKGKRKADSESEDQLEDSVQSGEAVKVGLERDDLDDGNTPVTEAVKIDNNDTENDNIDNTTQNPDNQLMDDVLGRILGKSHYDKSKTKEMPQTLQEDSEQQLKIGLNIQKSDSQVCRKVVGDGGMSYHLKMYQRMKERAQESGVPVEVEIAQRFGDVQKFMQLIRQAEDQAVPDRLHLKAARQRRIAAGKGSDTQEKKSQIDDRRSQYLQKDPSQTMQKPKEFSGRMFSSRRQKDFDRSQQTYKDKERHSYQQKTEQDPHLHKQFDKVDVQIKFKRHFQDDQDRKEKLEDVPETFNNEEEFQGDKQRDQNGDGVQIVFANDGSFMQQFEQSNKIELNVKQQVEEEPQSNLSMAQKLKRRLQALKNPEAKTQSISREHHSVPQIIDSSGKPMPGTFGRSDREYFKAQTSTNEGEDIRQTLKRMKYGEADFEELKGQQLGSGPSHIEDDDDFKEMEMSRGKKRKKLNMEQMQQIQHSKQVQQQKRWKTVYDKCRKCLGGPAQEPLKHLTIAIGQYSYLSLPAKKELVKNQCEIIPVEHIPSSRQVDEAVWTEIRNFKKSLIMMFKKQELEVIFMETALRVKGDYQRHTAIQAIPVDQDSFSRARFFFKKALEEAESEWSTHHAKRVIDTREKGLRRCIPAGFPYFNVEFGIEGGFVHVVDNESKFNEDLGRQTIVGLLQLPEQRMYAGDSRQGFQAEKQKVQQFLQLWEPFDWTKQLDD